MIITSSSSSSNVDLAFFSLERVFISIASLLMLASDAIRNADERVLLNEVLNRPAADCLTAMEVK